MRPRSLNEFVGQEHILGEGRLLRRAIQADMVSSLILYGPPGTGKTTLARVIANTTRSRFVSLNAVLSGVKDVREAIAEAKSQHELHGRRTILFVDEVHRWNKAQQDALLPWVENGTVILIGATTENPFFEVNSALVSRSRVFQLKTLLPADLRRIAERALEDPVRGYGRLAVRIDRDALDHLVNVSDGDARGLLGALQLAVETTPAQFPPEANEEIRITRETAEDSIQQKAILYDKEGDYHFDVISAFIKSVRGSDPDAALYWLAKMIQAGESPRYVFRRMFVSASEDVGLADPQALGIVEAAAAAFDRVGLPEGVFHLTQAALYLATAPKSNSTLAFFDAQRAIEKEAQAEVPNHLRDGNRDKEGFGHGEGYLYPHAYRDHWVAQAYLPDALRGRVFYAPSDQGYEGTIAPGIARRRELQLESAIAEPPPEVLSYSQGTDRRLTAWVRRVTEERESAARERRDRVSETLAQLRTSRVFLAGRTATLHLWEAIRRSPEGRVVCLIPAGKRLEMARHYAEGLPEIERPLILEQRSDGLLENEMLPAHEYDRILLADALGTRFLQERLLPAAAQMLATGEEPGRGPRLVITQRVPARSMRLSDLMPSNYAEERAVLERAEEILFASEENPLVNWDDQTLEQQVRSVMEVEQVALHESEEQRFIEERHILEWIDPGRPHGLGAALAHVADERLLSGIRSLLLSELAGRSVTWRAADLILVCRPPPGE